MATGSDRRTAFILAVASGVLFGGLHGLAQRSLSYGIVAGVVFGSIMPVVILRSARAGPCLAGLSVRQRRAVVTAVRKGRPIEDPALAEAVIGHARQVQRRAPSERRGLTLAWAFLGMSVVGLAAALVLGSAPGAIGAGFSLVVWAVILLVGPRLVRHTTDRARAAEEAAGRMLAER
jgi:hypothetical protein